MADADVTRDSNGHGSRSRLRWVGGLLFGIVVVVVVLSFILHSAGSGGASLTTLPPADTPPLQYVDLDAHRVATYVGQLEDGLATTEQRTEQLTNSVNASISAGSVAQASGTQQRQVGTQATVTATAADLFYAFMRLLRAGGEANCSLLRSGPNRGNCDPSRCNGTRRTRWLGEVDAQWYRQQILNQVSCIGVGNFIRIAHAQMFLPPFAQALPRAQSAQAAYGRLPARRTAFTSPTQSAQVQASLPGYTKQVGKDPRLPFVAAPYGSSDPVGAKVTFFVPVQYLGLTTEPALLSGSVTVVGKIIYYAPGGDAYIDYPTIARFGRPLLALLKQRRGFLDSIGVCSSLPPAAARSGISGPQPRNATCTSAQETLNAVKGSVTYNPPLVVVLPVAIYQ